MRGCDRSRRPGFGISNFLILLACARAFAHPILRCEGSLVNRPEVRPECKHPCLPGFRMRNCALAAQAFLLTSLVYAGEEAISARTSERVGSAVRAPTWR